MIKAVIFDCFGVLYSNNRSDFLSNVVSDFETHRDYLKDLGNQADYGLISEKDFYRGVAEVSGMGADEVENGLSEHTLNEKLIDYIKKLGTNYNIGIISNIGRGAFVRYFSDIEVKELFDDVVLSSEVGMIKPHPEIYELAAERLGFDTTECLFIDDIEDNVLGAEEVGMKGIVYENVNQVITAIEVLKEQVS